jgi:hypothetical protein
MTFGNWKVLGLSEEKSKDGKPLWICECQCENKTIKLYKRSDLKRGRTKSCGCMTKQLQIESLKKNYLNEYIFEGDICIVIANNTKNKYYIDAEDYNKIKNYAWYETKRGYMATSINQKTVMMHRIIMGLSDDDNRVVDHIYHSTNGKNDFYNNRKSNLRITTQNKNCENRGISKNNTSGTTGVAWSKNENAWKAYINYNHKRYSLGTYSDIDGAIKARKEKEIELFGEYKYKEAEGTHND